MESDDFGETWKDIAADGFTIAARLDTDIGDGTDLGTAFASLWARPIEAEPRAMDLSFNHPSTDQEIATLAERIS